MARLTKKLLTHSMNGTPFLYLDTKKLKRNCRDFIKYFPSAEIYYAVKANSNTNVLQIINEEGLRFDVASWDEIHKLKKLGVRAESMIFMAPTKIPYDIVSAHKFGIDRFAADSMLELEKLSKLAPKSKVFMRIVVDNEGSEWPLTRKFGVNVEEALPYFEYAKKLKLNPYGISFHVGSQNPSPQAWVNAFDSVDVLWKDLKKKGIKLEVMNIGGGFPIIYTKRVPSLKKFGEAVYDNLPNYAFKNAQIYLEPGRKVVGDTAVLVASVINRANRNGEEWLYLDVGVYHGLQESMEGIEYEVVTLSKSKKEIPYILAGATCDSTDKFLEGIMLPHDLKFGDKVFIMGAGAYTTSFEHYNGIPYPEEILEI